MLLFQPVPGQEPVKCEDAGDAFYRKKYKELKIENVQLNQIICENKRVIENLNASVAEDLERYALKLFDAQAKVEQHQTTIKSSFFCV